MFELSGPRDGVSACFRIPLLFYTRLIKLFILALFSHPLILLLLDPSICSAPKTISKSSSAYIILLAP